MVKCFVLYCWASIRRGIDVVFVLSADALLLKHLHTESGNGSPLYPYIPCCNVWERRRQNGEIVLCMGLVKFLEGHSDVAIADFQMYVQTCQLAGGESLSSADFAFSLLLLGDIYFQKSDTKRAYENWNRAKAICDSRSDWTAAKAALCDMLGRRLNDDFCADPGSEKQALRIFLLLDD